MPGVCACVCVCAHACVRICVHPKAINDWDCVIGTMWTKCDHLNKFYSFYKAAVVGIVSKHSLCIKPHNKNQPVYVTRFAKASTHSSLIKIFDFGHSYNLLGYLIDY